MTNRAVRISFILVFNVAILLVLIVLLGVINEDNSRFVQTFKHNFTHNYTLVAFNNKTTENPQNKDIASIILNIKHGPTAQRE